MIEIQNISKIFKLYRKPSERIKEILFRRCYHKKFQAVDHVSFQVRKGETLGIIGENGAGKSTILKLLTGILIPDEGNINISGKITGLLELGTGFNHEFSGIENIIHNAVYLGISKSVIDQKLDAIIEFAELGEFINKPLKTYSSGMIMRLAFSVAIHAEPEAFVVDEALSIGDAYFQQKCIKKIKEFKENKGSIIFVSHDMNAVKVLCDKAILLDRGKVVEYGTPEAIVNSYNYLIAQRSRGQQTKDTENLYGAGYGNRKVLIEKVTLLNEYKEESKIIVSGRPVSINVCLNGRKTVADMTLGFVIRDQYGLDMYGTNSNYLSVPIPIHSGQTLWVSYDFKEFNLGPGKYSLSVAVHTGANHVDECIHWLDRSAAFEVVSGKDFFFTGMVRLVPDLKVTKKSQGLN